MAEYYLPVKIGQRRMHICHLSDPNENFGFEFIIPIAGNDIELFSFSHDAKLLSSKGANSNIELKKKNYKVDHSEPDQGAINIIITFGEIGGIRDTPLKSSDLGISLARDSHHNFVAKATNVISVKRLNITILYKEKNSNGFEYSFVIHSPKESNTTKTYKAAIDFGSEASQVGFKTHSGSDQPHFIRLVDTLKEFYDQHNGITNFWQGKLNDSDPETSRLFKSVFFVCKSPGSGYEYDDVPNKYNDETILQTITPNETTYTETEANFYESLFLLPNLKLIELLADSNFLTDDIIFGSSQNNPRNLEGRVNILSNELIEDFIRLVLNNLLYGILKRMRTETRSEKYLHITLLMPNVYSQEKIYYLIRNIYSDFNEIIKNTEYSLFKGIEVQAMSESDASFIGARSIVSPDRANRISNKSYANYLVIDAGKGTTDFSIIKQQESFVKYDSQFRTGLPGSGQMLSFAFIEAINDFLTNIDLLELIKRESTLGGIGDILEFMENVETLKKKHTSFGELDDNIELDKRNEAFTRLSQINLFIETEFINKQKRIPGSNDKMNQKVTELVDKIEENICYSGISNFHQIVLAGRAFRFEPLLNAVKNRFDPIVIAENKFIFQNSHSKFICIEGAFQGENIHINLNSELIGSPVILNENDTPFIPAKKWYQFSSPGVEEKFINENFFYNGMKLNYDLNNKNIRIGARNYTPTPHAREAAQKYILFYTGEGFMLQWANGTSLLSAGRLPQSFSEMVKETLFPFAEISFSNNSVNNANAPEKGKEKPVEKLKKSEPKKSDSPKKTDSDDVLA